MKHLLKYAFMALMLGLSSKISDNSLKFKVDRISPRNGGSVVGNMNFDISLARMGEIDSDKMLLLLFNNKRIIYGQGRDNFGQCIIIKNAWTYKKRVVTTTIWIGYKFRVTPKGILIREDKPEVTVPPAT